MKKVFLTVVLFVSVCSFAKNSVEPSNSSKVQSPTAICCTATLTYNGIPVDSETVCGNGPLGENCNAAKSIVLARNAEAKKALSSS